ncbi:hypothetical protein MAPG_04079 [Magnaporthiopsis poae ATCC 64411]|uniref:Uncharacterized protein n=1 Tax=Magnaporthiopsis poae (strain ATCC 64411 / 73-15) TaxID=644358 RepID=A0A0C4DVR8_MAGP6|nr:hypothetical protein MAPG_04079 [Magnaporthiopsis poae ATCC 64411]
MFAWHPIDGTEGFIIDVPTHLSTMVASGLLVFKVLNESGEHLVCLDTRKGRRIIQPGDKTVTTSSMNIGREDVLWDEADSKAVTQQSNGETVQYCRQDRRDVSRQPRRRSSD